MKIALFALIALLALAPVASAENFGSLFGAMATGQATGRGNATLSGTLGLTDATSFIAGVTYGFSDKADGRFRLGVVENDGFDTQIALQGDVRWQIWNVEDMKAAKPKPFDMSI
jgi:hypothetical protein